MKKIKKIILFLAFLFMLTGCDIYVYNFDDPALDDSTNDDSSNLSGNNSGSTIVDSNSSYSGFINYTSSVPAQSKSWNEVYETVKSSVVTIRALSTNGGISQGSGVIFAQDSISIGNAYIYTNAHVVEGSSSIEVLLHNDILVKGTLIGYDRIEDVAVVKIAKRADYTIATLRHSNTLRIGEPILAIGSPIGEKYSGTATSGIISNLNIAIKPDNSTVDLYLIQIDAALNPGNSGGPLFDNAGNLIGINTIKLINSGTATNIESFNYSIPISHFSLVAKYLLQGSYYYRPFLSISVVDIKHLTFAERDEYNLEINHGLLILEIDNISPLNNKASKNQVITHIEGVEVLKSSDFSVELLKHAPNDTITLTICNADGSNSHNIQVTLIKR